MDNQEVENRFNKNTIMADEFIRKFLDEYIKHKPGMGSLMINAIASMMIFTINNVTEKIAGEINHDAEKVFLMILDSFQNYILSTKREITSKKLS